MSQIYWQGEPLALEASQDEGVTWLWLEELAVVLAGYLQDLPGGAVGFCLPDDRCLPLGVDDLREDGGRQRVRLSALAPLGIVGEDGQPAARILLGDPLPKLTFSGLDGGSRALRDLVGKATILFVWASW